MLLLPGQLLEMYGSAPSTTPVNTGCDVVVGEPYSFTFTASGATGAVTWVLLSGSFPPGLTLSSSGVLSGTPTDFTGFYSFTVQATDSVGNVATITCSFTGGGRMAFLCLCPGPELVTTLITTVAAVTTLVKCKLIHQPWTVETTVQPLSC